MPNSTICCYCATDNMNQSRQQAALLTTPPRTSMPNEPVVNPADLQKLLDPLAYQIANPAPAKDTSSGGDNDYWVANVTDPKRLAPYKAECEDLIELFGFNFAEGNAFKALWRMGMDRVAQGKPGDTPLRNAQKVAYYGERMRVQQQRLVDSVEERFQDQRAPRAR